MPKKVLLLIAALLLFVVAIAVPTVFADNQLFSGFDMTLSDGTPPIATPIVAAPDTTDWTFPPAGPRGWYIENSTDPTRIPIDPVAHSAVGSFFFLAWSQLEYGNNNYDWNKLDGLIQKQLDAGYQAVGLAFYTYTGRQGVTCPDQGVEHTVPAFVLKGADGIANTGDEPMILSSEPDGGRPNRAGCEDGPWYLLDYMHPYYRAQYSEFIHALADHLLNSPYRSSVGWIATGVGMDGENRAADNRSGVGYDESFLFKPISNGGAGWTIADWEEYVKWVIDQYTDAFYDGSGFPRIQVLTQNSPHPGVSGGPTSRRAIAQYAATHRVGLSINNMRSDFNTVEKCDHPDPNKWCTGMYDQARQYNDVVPIGFESYGYMMNTENEFYWSVARAFDFPGDYFRLSGFWSYADTPNRRLVAQWAQKYFGSGFRPGETEPPSVWSMMREHRNPCISGAMYTDPCNDWPTNGNYEFYLTQLHLANQGTVTIPVTDDPRIHNTGWTGVINEPWHYNSDPFSPALYDAGLLHYVGEKGDQIELDPGMVARRSDQASGNYRFAFDAADSYFTRSGAPAESTFKVVINVSYLDYGTDQWSLIYDSVTGPKPAQVFAINDWDLSNGLALAGDLTATGKLTDTTYAVQKTGSGQWKVATFKIDDGDFNNLLVDQKADFFIDTRGPNGEMDGDEYIHFVDVQKVAEFIEVTPTNTPAPTPTDTPAPTSTPTPTLTSTPTSTPTPAPTATPTPTTGVISGKVFADYNGNGQYDAGEDLPGATLTLSIGGDYTTTSDADGSYSFSDLPPANYMLSETPPAGYGEAQPVSSIFVSVQANSVFTWDFLHDPISTVTPTPTPQPFLYLPLIQQ
ncbi:MAG: hypothetical protein GXP37_10690 [Chloroflexi bacterium]|nr:hypothetical protein [Chloroflexota bacterium]